MARKKQAWLSKGFGSGRGNNFKPMKPETVRRRERKAAALALPKRPTPVTDEFGTRSYPG